MKEKLKIQSSVYPPNRKVTTSATYNHKEQKREEPKGKSLTVQGEGISVAEMLRRLASGMPLTGGRGEWQDEDMDINDLDLQGFMAMDIVDQEMVLEGMKETRALYERMVREKGEESPEPKETPNKVSESDQQSEV